MASSPLMFWQSRICEKLKLTPNPDEIDKRLIESTSNFTSKVFSSQPQQVLGPCLWPKLLRPANEGHRCRVILSGRHQTSAHICCFACLPLFHPAWIFSSESEAENGDCCVFIVCGSLTLCNFKEWKKETVINLFVRTLSFPQKLGCVILMLPPTRRPVKKNIWLFR